MLSICGLRHSEFGIQGCLLGRLVCVQSLAGEDPMLPSPTVDLCANLGPGGEACIRSFFNFLGDPFWGPFSVSKHGDHWSHQFVVLIKVRDGVYACWATSGRFSGRNGPKMAHRGPKWQGRKRAKKGRKGPKLAEKGPHMAKKGRQGPNMAKKGPKGPNPASHPRTMPTKSPAKWPTNGAR